MLAERSNCGKCTCTNVKCLLREDSLIYRYNYTTILVCTKKKNTSQIIYIFLHSSQNHNSEQLCAKARVIIQTCQQKIVNNLINYTQNIQNLDILLHVVISIAFYFSVILKETMIGLIDAIANAKNHQKCLP